MNQKFYTEFRKIVINVITVMRFVPSLSEDQFCNIVNVIRSIVINSHVFHVFVPALFES
jgi:hypothetical protein